MTAALTAIEGYEPAIIGAMVALIAWSILQLIVARSSKPAPKPAAKRRPIPITREALAQYLITNPLVIETETRLAVGLGLELTSEIRDLTWAEEKARALGITDIAALDRLLKGNEQRLLTFACRFKWKTFHREDVLRLLFQILGESLGTERHRLLIAQR